MMVIMLYLVVLTLSCSHAFVTAPTRAPTRGVSWDTTIRSSSLAAWTPLDPTAAAATPLLVSSTVPQYSLPSLQIAAETDSWRQYVPLIVSLLVITDILLGSPAANAVLSVARKPAEQALDDNNAAAADATTTPADRDLRERVDTMAVAQAALDKASATTELRKFLDESKSDMEKMRDVQSKLDAQLREFDRKQQEKNQD